MRINTRILHLFIILAIILMLVFPIAKFFNKTIAVQNFSDLAGIIVTKEPYRHYRYFITDKRTVKKIAWNLAVMIKVNEKPISCTYRLTFVFSNGMGREFSYLPAGYLYDLSTGQLYRISHSLQKILNREIYKAKHQVNESYGELIPWSEVNKLFPKNAFCTVIDFETGLRFLVQRRAGSYHADVQPLTCEDTAIMKKIYGGKWSWERRPVIVEINGMRIAASMNGMPHGAGAIQTNNFPGHFCIHFWGSRLHKNKRIDKAHQRMVLKAAGMW